MSDFNNILFPEYPAVISNKTSINRTRILIWEAELIVALHLKKILQKAAYEPIIIKHKDDIFTLLINVNPELLIISSDLNSETLTRLVPFVRDLHTSIIVLSTQSEYIINRHLRINSPNYLIISKPFTNDELLQSISICLKGN